MRDFKSICCSVSGKVKGVADSYTGFQLKRLNDFGVDRGNEVKLFFFSTVIMYGFIALYVMGLIEIWTLLNSATSAVLTIIVLCLCRIVFGIFYKDKEVYNERDMAMIDCVVSFIQVIVLTVSVFVSLLPYGSICIPLFFLILNYRKMIKRV